MASFDKLRVQGIRSFAPSSSAGFAPAAPSRSSAAGTSVIGASARHASRTTNGDATDNDLDGDAAENGDDSSKQSVLIFQKPLTIIVGANGSGKTTLIECLKYATTGDVPSGRTKISEFVHDPKLNYVGRVDASVQLSFHDVTDKPSTVTRRLSAVLKGKKVEIKTDEQNLCRTSADGRKVKISSKIADVNREVPALLGVSRSILNNVIFCHQESSNWPLDVPKDVKAKFDEIFSATRYVECLVSIKKQENVLKGRMKDAEKDFSHFLDQRGHRQKDETQRVERERERVTLSAALDDARRQLAPVDADVERLQTRIQRFNDVRNELHGKQVQLRMLEGQEENLRNRIADEWTGTRDELRRTMDDFERKNRDPEQRHRQLKSEQERLEMQKEELMNEEKRITTSIGSLQTSVQILKAKTDTLCRKLQVALTEHDIQGDAAAAAETSLTQVKMLVNALGERCRQMYAEKAACEESRSVSAATLQAERDTALERQAALKQQMETYRSQIAANKTEILKAKASLDQLKGVDIRLRDFDRRIEQKETELTLKRDSEKALSYRRAIDEAKASKTGCDDKLRALSLETRDAQTLSSTVNEVSFLEKNLTDKRADAQRLLDTHRNTAVAGTRLFADAHADGFRRRADSLVSSTRQRRVDAEKAVQTTRVELTDTNSRLQQTKQRLGETQREADELRRSLQQSVGTEDITTQLEKLDITLHAKRDEKGNIDGGQYIYKKYVGRLEDKACCPLCERDFRPAKLAKDLIQKLRTKMTGLPSEAARLASEIAAAERTRSALLSAKPLGDRRTVIEAETVPALTAQIDTLTDKAARLSETIEKKTKLLRTAEDDEMTANSLVSPAAQLDSIQSEIQQLELDLKQKRKKLLLDGGRSLEEIQREIDVVTDKKEAAESDIETAAKALERHLSAVRELEDQTHALRAERVSLKESQVAATATHERLLAAETDVRQLGERLARADADLAPLTRHIHDIQDRIAEANRESEKQMSDMTGRINALEHRRNDISVLLKEVTGMSEEDISEAALRRCSDERRSIERRLTTADADLTANRSQLEALAEGRTNRDYRKTQLMSNWELIETRLRRSTLDAEVRALVGDDETGMDEEEYAQLERQRKQLAATQAQLQRTINQNEGAVKQLQSALKDSDQKLRLYDGLEQKFTDAKIRLLASTGAAKDLAKYYKAMDNAIIKFHSKKMEDINRILKELWKTVYQNEDIQYIQIRSEETDEGKTDKRKAYNYRVMLIMDGQEIEMRGRCSAGQKVLASILIRLALAEVFCINCGMLTLDEPTANLDQDKVESLSRALADLVLKRQETQANFQLVIITHDERFLRLLVNGCRPEYFWSVAKDINGYSRLTRHRGDKVDFY